MRWRDKVGEEGVGGCSEVISRTYSIKQTGADDRWCWKETARHIPSHVLPSLFHPHQDPRQWKKERKKSAILPDPSFIHRPALSSSNNLHSVTAGQVTVQYTASASVHRYTQTPKLQSNTPTPHHCQLNQNQNQEPHFRKSTLTNQSPHCDQMWTGFPITMVYSHRW